MSRPAARLDPGPILIRVHGMRRSGNHAVIDWLRRNLPGETVFLNDCAPGDPYASFQMMETPRGDRHGPSFRDTRWYAQFEGHRERFDHIVSYEDRAPGETLSGWTSPWTTVIVHRGFLGWLASYWGLVMVRQRGTRWGVREPSEIGRAIRLYAELLRARTDAVEIGLERWAADEGYRRGRLAALGLPRLDDSTGDQSSYGGGSSFEPGADAPDAGALAGRWRRLAEEPAFEELVLDAARDDAFMGALKPIYPEDAARLARLAQGGRLRDER